MILSDLLNNLLPDWGICSFECIKDRLIPCRALTRLPQKPESVIMAVFPYLLHDSLYENRNISKYAVVHDYHDIISDRLNKARISLAEMYPSGSFEIFADNSPVPEVYAACRAGLGVKGRNGMLINNKFGSYVFIGEIVTDIKLDAADCPVLHCMECGKCMEVCPSKAIQPDKFNIEKCISGISQRKSELNADETAMINALGCAWGCDICQDVCPMNKNVHNTAIREFVIDPVPHISQETSLEGRAFAWRGAEVIRRNLKIIGEKQCKSSDSMK